MDRKFINIVCFSLHTCFASVENAVLIMNLVCEQVTVLQLF